eukprot:g2671.t1
MASLKRCHANTRRAAMGFSHSTAAYSVIALYCVIPCVILLLVAHRKFHVHRYGINLAFCLLLLANCVLSIIQWSLSLSCDWHGSITFVHTAGAQTARCGTTFQVVRALAQCAFFSCCMLVVVRWLTAIHRKRHLQRLALCATATYVVFDISLLIIAELRRGELEDRAWDVMGSVQEAGQAAASVVMQLVVLALGGGFRRGMLQERHRQGGRCVTLVVAFALWIVLLSLRAVVLLFAACVSSDAMPNTESHMWLLILAGDVLPCIFSAYCLLYLMWTPDIARTELLAARFPLLHDEDDFRSFGGGVGSGYAAGSGYSRLGSPGHGHGAPGRALTDGTRQCSREVSVGHGNDGAAPASPSRAPASFSEKFGRGMNMSMGIGPSPATPTPSLSTDGPGASGGLHVALGMGVGMGAPGGLRGLHGVDMDLRRSADSGSGSGNSRPSSCHPLLLRASSSFAEDEAEEEAAHAEAALAAGASPSREKVTATVVAAQVHRRNRQSSLRLDVERETAGVPAPRFVLHVLVALEFVGEPVDSDACPPRCWLVAALHEHGDLGLGKVMSELDCQLEQEIVGEWLAYRLHSRRMHLAAIEESLDVCRSGLVYDSHGQRRCTFKPSTAKKQPECQFLPLNCHLQQMRASLVAHGDAGEGLAMAAAATAAAAGGGALANNCPGVAMPPTTGVPLRCGDSAQGGADATRATGWRSGVFRQPCIVYDTVTVGAPAAHALGFGGGGLREMHTRTLAGLRRRVFGDDQDKDKNGAHVHIALGTSASGTFGGASSGSSNGAMGGDISPRSQQSGSAGTVAVALDQDVERRGANADGNGDGRTANVADRRRSLPPASSRALGAGASTAARRALLDLEWAAQARGEVVLVQAFSTLAAAVVQRLDLLLQLDGAAAARALRQLVATGLLVHWESLLSTLGAEKGMLADTDGAVGAVDGVAFRLHAGGAAGQGSMAMPESIMYVATLEVELPTEIGAAADEETGGTTGAWAGGANGSVAGAGVATSAGGGAGLPHPALLELLGASPLLCVTNVLFSQGINEMQSLANLSHHVPTSNHAMQSDINSEGVRKLRGFVARSLAVGDGSGGGGWGAAVAAEWEGQLREIEKAVAHASNTKNVGVLQLTGAFCRALGGARVVMCKSAKDRTGMAVTLEQAHLLKRFHSLDFLEVRRATGLFRLFGTRPENALKNIGERMFAFNSLQRRMLPPDYRPPPGVARGVMS